MKILKLAKENLDFFASVLHQFGEIHAPVRQNGEHVFRRIGLWSEACLHYNRTILPPKKYFLPSREALLGFSEDAGYTERREDLDRKIVLLGVHACDIYALNILDLVFGGKYPDPYYQVRRKNVAIVGVDCTPDENCFCYSMRADFVDSGFDLFLSDIGDYFLTFVGSARGDDMVLSTEPLFEPVEKADIDEYKRRSALKQGAYQLAVEIRDFPKIFEMEYQNEIWEELGARCLACGNCSTVCPTCYCFDVFDETQLGSLRGQRLRTWDSCLFLSHAEVAGGENFRGGRDSRIKFRFYHKQLGFVAEHGRPSCVGCGRCIVHCPVKINIVEVINRLRGADYVSDRSSRHAS